MPNHLENVKALNRQMRGALRGPKMLTWTVEFSVSENWVADGFDLTDEQAREMIEQRLGYAYEHELGAKVIKRPTQAQIVAAEQSVG